MRVEDGKKIFGNLFKEVQKEVVGQDETIAQIIIALLTDSHVLLEGFPGLAKTLTIRTLSRLLDLKFARIQNTPDLMPSDITGTYIIEETGGKRDFKFQPGPIFANVVLADEINRATPKTQSAMLEAMQERQVTVGGVTYPLERPFFVLATQNPIDQEGTYALPEAQSDRFLLKILVGYPKFDEEVEIVNRFAEDVKPPQLKPILSKKELQDAQSLCLQIPVAADMKKYAVSIVENTRNAKELIEFGASPRASIGLVIAAKARAMIAGRKYVVKEDINAVALPVLRHRIILTFEAERQNMSADDVIKKMLK